jgi:hypothetical protein
MSQIKHKGLALIIDEKLGDEGSGDKINKIAKIIKSNKIPYWGCANTIEAKNILENLSDVSFIIMDWNLTEIDQDVTASENINISSNISFLRALKDFCFAPVIILSALGPEDIIQQIQSHDATLYDSNSNRNFILIKSKDSVLKRGQLFRTINKWIENNPTIYTLKTWEHSFFTAKNVAFWDLFSKSPMWPRILWDVFKQDEIDESVNIYNVIDRLISGRINKQVLKEEHVNGKKSKLDIADIKKVIAGTMYISELQLPKKDIQPGDIFESPNGFLINIRPECDTVGRNGQNLSEIKLYLLKCTKLENKRNFVERYNKTTGIVQRLTDFCVFGIDGENFYKIKFKDIVIKKYSDLKRIKRLLPPHINYLQQSYANYSARVGLPRIPHTVVKNVAQTLN